MLALFAHIALGADLSSSLGSALKSRGDGMVATVASCGPSLLCDALGGRGAVSVVEGSPTALALLRTEDSSEGAVAVAASDVVVLELRMADLTQRSAHGLAAQLRPLLQRSLRLHHVRPQKKLLLVTVTDFDGGLASEADVAAFVSAEVDALWGGLLKPSTCEAAAAGDALEVQCAFLPHPSLAEEAFGAALASLAARFTDAASPAYLFADGRRSAPAAATAAAVERFGAEGAAPKPAPPAEPAEVAAAYRCTTAAEEAAREFQKGAAALKKAGEGALLPDFGEQARARARGAAARPLPPPSLLPSAALPPPFSLLTPPPPPLSQAGSLVSDALDRFDAASESLKGAPSVDAARAALQEQLQRALYPPFRRQLAAAQRNTLSAFRQKLAALKPTAEVEVELKGMVKEALDGFGETAKALLPPTTKWGYGYEKSAVAATLKEQAQAHVETLRVQGLYLPKEGRHKPIDIGVHWLLLEFGGDRLLNLAKEGEPAFKEKAEPMRLRATTGYQPGQLSDPKQMVFDGKMLGQ